tara:strand:+ start:230 stop:469 length:240 start_codon:yes stop_codon:yes gene_type:complete
MIQKVDDGYVISSRGVWLPGVYESEKAARVAFMLSDAVLASLQEKANLHAGDSGGVVTHRDVIAALRWPTHNEGESDHG